MCKAMEDLRDQSFQEGVKEGVKEGLERGMREGVEKGMKEGVAKGMKEGVESQKRTAVLQMLRIGKYSLDEIADVNGLSLNEVKKMQAEQYA